MMLLTYLVNRIVNANEDMDIHFQGTREAAFYSDFKKLRIKYGEKRAKYIRRRLDELRAANCLEDMRGIGDCHEWPGDKDCTVSIDLDGPNRLLFVPSHNPIPKKQDGGLDWYQVFAIKIVKVEDPHG